MWGEVAAGLRVSRPVLVARLLELEAAGALTTAHVRAGAQVGGVNVRTVWRWLEAARTEGRMESRPRARLELSDQAWEALAQAGGNVAALYRHLKEAGDQVHLLASLHRAVRRDLEAGGVMPDRAVVRREREEQQTRWALADLVLAGPREGGAEKASAPPRLVPEAAGGVPVGQSGAVAGVALPAGAQSAAARCAAVSVGLLRFIRGIAVEFSRVLHKGCVDRPASHSLDQRAPSVARKPDKSKRPTVWITAENQR
ncbi:hypothetical protein [Streptomyces sp. NPDC014995]|uniref:hypothetical protein n=1 Tax=Streptomyces sp. NPDC014995 TaxID=3364936 RepID=UPI0036FA1796